MSDLCPVAVGQDLLENEQQPETAGESHLLLLKQKKYCDVTFTFPNHPDRIQAHEIYLKARSPVFAKIFRMRKSGNVQGNKIEISDTTPDVFQQFLEFIYADKFEVDIARALELLQLSQKFKVHPLTKKCDELLKTEIPILHSVKVFQTARRYGRRELMDRAGRIMVKSFARLARTGALANAEEETFVYLLNCDDLIVKEVELFQMILKWGKNQVGNPADEEILRSKLKSLISKIRFTNMAPEEFTKVVVPTGLLSAEETISVYSYFCGDEVTRKDLKIIFNTTRRKDLTETFSELNMSAEGGGNGDSAVSSSSSYTAPCKAAPAGGSRRFQTTASTCSSAKEKPPLSFLQNTPDRRCKSLVSALAWRRTFIEPAVSSNTSMHGIISDKPAGLLPWAAAQTFPKRPAPKANVSPRRQGGLTVRPAVSGRDDHWNRGGADRNKDRSWTDYRPDRGLDFRDHWISAGDRNPVYQGGKNQGLDRGREPSGPPKEQGTNRMHGVKSYKVGGGECFERSAPGLDYDPIDFASEDYEDYY